MNKYNIINIYGIIIATVEGILQSNPINGTYPYEILDVDNNIIAIIPEGFIIKDETEDTIS